MLFVIKRKKKSYTFGYSDFSSGTDGVCARVGVAGIRALIHWLYIIECQSTLF